MTDTNHISLQDWMALFSNRAHDAEWMRLQSRIMEHANACEQCGAFYQRASALRDAAAALAAFDAAGDGSAYLAAASGEPWRGRKESPSRGSLSVCLECGPDGAVFIEQTLEQEGCAEKYAMNPEEDGRRLADDGGELTLDAAPGRLTASLADDGVRCRWQLLPDDGDALDGALDPGGAPAGIPLPAQGFVTLELVFTD